MTATAPKRELTASDCPNAISLEPDAELFRLGNIWEDLNTLQL